MYINRWLTPAFQKALAGFPAVFLSGPRQAGKTTFLKKETGEKRAYISFDDPGEREFARSDPRGFLDRFAGKPVILDEVQYVPDLFSHLKLRIDQERERFGKWILTGSQQFQLMKGISETLAGRVALLEILPFSILERSATSLEKAIWTGGYPEPSLAPGKRDLWMGSYIQTYVERDLRQLQNIKDLRTFELFLGLAASRSAQEFNASALSRDTGVSVPTIKSWASLLEASFLAFFLPPWHGNYGKRLVKSPKLYSLDSALLCSLTRQPDAPSALGGSMGGALFEGWVVSEAVKAFSMKGLRPDLYFWRSREGLEVDLLVRVGGKLTAVEIKLTATPNPGHLKPLEKFKALAGKDASKTGLLVCRVKEPTPLPHGNIALPWNEFPKWLWERLGKAGKRRPLLPPST